LAFTGKMADKKQITPEFDPRDKYGRISTYVYLTESTFLNAEIIEPGHRSACTRFPFKYMEDFRRHEKETKEISAGRGEGEDFPKSTGLVNDFAGLIPQCGKEKMEIHGKLCLPKNRISRCGGHHVRSEEMLMTQPSQLALTDPEDRKERETDNYYRGLCYGY